MFIRYTDDIIVPCGKEKEAEQVLEAIKSRMAVCQMRINEEKTKIVFCKRYKKTVAGKTVKFDFLCFSFQPRPNVMKKGGMFLGYDCAWVCCNSRKRKHKKFSIKRDENG